jgi:hypothetical protein
MPTDVLFHATSSPSRYGYGDKKNRQAQIKREREDRESPGIDETNSQSTKSTRYYFKNNLRIPSHLLYVILFIENLSNYLCAKSPPLVKV